MGEDVSWLSDGWRCTGSVAAVDGDVLTVRPHSGDPEVQIRAADAHAL